MLNRLGIEIASHLDISKTEIRSAHDWQFSHRIDPEILRIRERRRRFRQGIGRWFCLVEIDLKRLLAYRGGHDQAIEVYLRVPELVYRSNSTRIGEDVELKWLERVILGITSMRPCDMSWRECRRKYKIIRNRRKCHRARLKRLAEGRKPWSESLARTKPWEAEGISRSTWYKRRKSVSDESVPPPSGTEERMADICPSRARRSLQASQTSRIRINVAFSPHGRGIPMLPSAQNRPTRTELEAINRHAAFQRSIAERAEALKTKSAEILPLPQKPSDQPILVWPVIPERKILTITDITRTVARYFHVTVDELIGPAREKRLVLPRHIAIYLCHDLTDRSKCEISRRFGDRDHATIHHAIARVGNCRKNNIGDVARDVAALIAELR